MSIINNLIDSIEHYLVSNTNLKAFVYSDNTLMQELTCNVKTNLVGTELTFIVQNGGTDLTSTEYPNFLLNRYITFNGISKRITAYNGVTGAITIESKFDVPILTTDEIIISIVDSVFIYTGNKIDSLHGTNSAQQQNVRVYFRVTSKDDVRGERNETILEQIKVTFYSVNFSIKIFEDKNFNTYKGMTTIGNTSFNDNTLDIKNNDYVNLTSILLSYYIKIN